MLYCGVFPQEGYFFSTHNTAINDRCLHLNIFNIVSYPVRNVFFRERGKSDIVIIVNRANVHLHVYLAHLPVHVEVDHTKVLHVNFCRWFGIWGFNDDLGVGFFEKIENLPFACFEFEVLINTFLTNLERLLGFVLDYVFWSYSNLFLDGCGMHHCL